MFNITVFFTVYMETCNYYILYPHYNVSLYVPRLLPIFCSIETGRGPIK